MRILPYLQLMRLHQPTGIWLLLWPCWWGLALAAHPALPPLRLMALFALGAVLMRGAGCIVNDIWDREFDKQVERTKHRPIASGAISVRQALVFLFLLMIPAFAVMFALPPAAWWLAIASLPLVMIYPLMKRITWWPQAFLGLTFNWGALMGWAAVRGQIELPALLLYAAGFFWTLGYDTIYAFQDRSDDIRAGVKSTARILAPYGRWPIFLFFACMLLLLFAAGYHARIGNAFHYGIFILASCLFWQAGQVTPELPSRCKSQFQAHGAFGGVVFLLLMLS